MTKTLTITAVTTLLLLMAASIWMFSGRTSHEIVIAPVQQGVQR